MKLRAEAAFAEKFLTFLVGFEDGVLRAVWNSDAVDVITIVIV